MAVQDSKRTDAKTTTKPAIGKLQFHPLTPERWPDLDRLFGPRGACGGCWCMFWRLQRSEFLKGKGEGNRKALRRLVKSGECPGLLAYIEGEPVGWCAVAPREVYTALERSRILRSVDDQTVWSVSCLFVAKPYRGKGIATKLLTAAQDHARRQGARILEGYPVESFSRRPDPFVWTGLASSFLRAGFAEVARRSKTRPIMRCRLTA